MKAKNARGLQRMTSAGATIGVAQLQEIEPKMITITVTRYASLHCALGSLVLQANVDVLRRVDPAELLKVGSTTPNERQRSR
ncbi:MAG: hypothetical protein ABSC87_08320 [Halobacteriota archaeon]